MIEIRTDIQKSREGTQKELREMKAETAVNSQALIGMIPQILIDNNGRYMEYLRIIRMEVNVMKEIVRADVRQQNQAL
jgi:hypothetical protein